MGYAYISNGIVVGCPWDLMVHSSFLAIELDKDGGAKRLVAVMGIEEEWG